MSSADEDAAAVDAVVKPKVEYVEQFIQKMRADGKYDEGIASLSAFEISKLLDEALMGKDLTKYTADSDETYNAFFEAYKKREVRQLDDLDFNPFPKNKQTNFLVKYLGRSNFYNLLLILVMYPVVTDIMQAFVNLLLKDGVTHFKVQDILAVRTPHNPFLQQPDSSPFVPISLSYMATLVDNAVKKLQGKPIPEINDVNVNIKQFYEFSYGALYEYFKNYLRIKNIEPASFVVDQEFTELVSLPIILTFKLFMFPILNKLCELNQYEETHEDVKNIDFMDLVIKRKPEMVLSLAAPSSFDGGRRSYQKKNRTNKRLKKNTRIKNKKKCSSSRKYIKNI